MSVELESDIDIPDEIAKLNLFLKVPHRVTQKEHGLTSLQLHLFWLKVVLMILQIFKTLHLYKVLLCFNRKRGQCKSNIVVGY